MALKSRSERDALLPGLLCAVVAALSPLSAQAQDPLGRLFTTPQQRQQLNELRRAELENPAISLAPSSAPQDAPAESSESSVNPLTIKGLVTRDGGRSMAWINESNTYEGDLSSEYLRVRSADIDGEEIRVFTPYGEEAVSLKVGQTLEPSTGKIIDVTDSPPPSPEHESTSADPAAPRR